MLAENAGYEIAAQMERDAQRRLTNKDREEMQEREGERDSSPQGDDPPPAS